MSTPPPSTDATEATEATETPSDSTGFATTLGSLATPVINYVLETIRGKPCAKRYM